MKGRVTEWETGNTQRQHPSIYYFTLRDEGQTLSRSLMCVTGLKYYLPEAGSDAK